MKIIKSITSGAAIMALSLSAYAGKHVKGEVDVYLVGFEVVMAADMNVRFNDEQSSSSFVGVSYNSTDKTVYFEGSDTGFNFSCKVSPTSSLYDTALSIANNLRHGSRIIVRRYNFNNLCRYIHVTHRSDRLE
ncbi:MAG: hypothetical protein OQL06_05285 [Gammaproteobacteria bacterium]|nr:hypothetical protein [Gammaproteobacteria bacterium]